MSEEVYLVDFWEAGMDTNCESEGDYWDPAQTAQLFSWLGSRASLNHSMFWHLDCCSRWGNNSEAGSLLWKKPPFDIFCSKQVLGSLVPDCLEMFLIGDKLFNNNFNSFLRVFHLAPSYFLSLQPPNGDLKCCLFPTPFLPLNLSFSYISQGSLYKPFWRFI